MFSAPGIGDLRLCCWASLSVLAQSSFQRRNSEIVAVYCPHFVSAFWEGKLKHTLRMTLCRAPSPPPADQHAENQADDARARNTPVEGALCLVEQRIVKDVGCRLKAANLPDAIFLHHGGRPARIDIKLLPVRQLVVVP